MKQVCRGGTLKIVNRTVPDALNRLGYSDGEIGTSSRIVEKFDTIEDVKEDGETRQSGLKPEHLDVFDCAFKRPRRTQHFTWHISDDGRCPTVHQRRDIQDHDLPRNARWRISPTPMCRRGSWG